MTDFQKEIQNRIEFMSKDAKIQKASSSFMTSSTAPKYSYNFLWQGRPIIQYPQDIVAMQEIIWEVKPDLIIETGIAHGGSLILYASMLSLIETAEALEKSESYNPANSKRKVLGIDIDIRDHNKKAIDSHPMSNWIEMIEGSSIDLDVINQVKSIAMNYNNIIVLLDSNHTHDHVLAELEAYASLVSIGSYCVVFDTIIEDLPSGTYPDRSWDIGNNPKTAVHKYLSKNSDFEVDQAIHQKLLITVAPDGYLKRVR